MADEIRYVYESMDEAYETMKRIAGNIQSSCEEMTSDALRMLQSNEGRYARAYQEKLTKLNSNIEELNNEMAERAKRLQEKFNDMGYADIRLGDGF